MPLSQEPKFRPGSFWGMMDPNDRGVTQMTNETVKALLMIVLFTSVEITLYLPRIQAHGDRMLRRCLAKCWPVIRV